MTFPRFTLLSVSCGWLALSLVATASAQDAAPADRNDINTAKALSTMEVDSPVVFPKSGPIPPKYPPDVKVQSFVPEPGYSIVPTPNRSLEQINRIQAEMPAGKFTPPPNDWRFLERTHERLKQGGKLHIMAIGDSIVADTMRSGWIAKLQEAYPNARIQSTLYVRGGGGCQHYREEGRIQKNVLPRKPDLVFIGGISQKDLGAIRDVIQSIRTRLPEVEFLLGSGSFGKIDPRRPELWKTATHNGSDTYRNSLRQLAAEEKCAYLDFTSPWGEYMRSTGLHPHLLYRDLVHANEAGEQILSKILLSYFQAP